MKSSIVKRSIIIDGHKTSVSLEDAFWSDLKEIAHSQQATVSKLIAQIDDTRQQGNLSSAIRLHVLEHMRSRGQGKEKTKSSSIAPSLPCDTKVASAI
jgi:predicted DNA-binding ribbon-helix-helix protein